MTSIQTLQRVLDDALGGDFLPGSDDPNGLWRRGRDPVRSVGLLLEADKDAITWIEEHGLDALVVHRPWTLPENLPGRPSVLAYHLAFDERLTIGMSPYLARELGMVDIEPIGDRDGRPIGMLGTLEPTTFAAFADRIEAMFGAAEVIRGRTELVGHVAAVGAMRAELIEEASRRGADVYLTGDLRRGALPAVQQAGIGLLAVGGPAAERWGMRVLAGIIRERLPEVRVVILGR